MTNENSTFHGEICVITGAASGIGRALAIKLAEAGAMLALSDINEEELEETAKLCGAANSNRIITDRLDMADAEAIAAYAPRVKEALGSAKHVFNVAGLARVGNFIDADLEAFEKVIDVNFYGVVRMSKAFVDQLIESKGHLTNISSVFGFIGREGNASYCASKFGVRGFSETLSVELADKGVSVHSVHPGGIDTNIVRNAEVDKMPDGMASKEDLQATFKQLARTSPEQAAQVILGGVAKNKKRILIGDDAKAISIIHRLFPESYTKVLDRLFSPKKD